jgi:hypothetical protein
MVGRRPAAGGGGGLILGDRQAQWACWEYPRPSSLGSAVSTQGCGRMTNGRSSWTPIPPLPCGASSVKNGGRQGHRTARSTIPYRYGTGEHNYHGKRVGFYVFLYHGDKNGIGHPERDRSYKVFCCSKNLSLTVPSLLSLIRPSSNPKTDGY